MYLMWYGLGRTWIENVRINYSTVILRLRTNVWTAIIVFVLGCILFVVSTSTGRPQACAGACRRSPTSLNAEHQKRNNLPEKANQSH